jgi:hypothetical protein
MHAQTLESKVNAKLAATTAALESMKLKTPQTKQAGHTAWHRKGTHIYMQQNPGGVKTAIAEVFRDVGAQAADDYAELIVRAVNSHQELLEALQSCENIFKGWVHDANPHHDIEPGESIELDAATSALEMVQAAIAKAGGEA